jgi:hypothetical protein
MVLGGVPAKYRASLWRALCYAHPWTSQQRTSEPDLYAVQASHAIAVCGIDCHRLTRASAVRV